MNEFIISFRESLEAALIVGIILTVLIRNGRKDLLSTVWLSIAASLVASVALGLVIYGVIERQGSEAMQALLEGVLMYITAGLLIYVIFWMKKNMVNHEVIAGQVNAAAGSGRWSIFLLVFFAILREGFETAIFLVASTSVDGHFSYIGFFTGILLAVLIGYMIVAQGRKVQLKKFFSATSLLLVFFAAGMVAYGTHELYEYAEKSAVAAGKEEPELEVVYNIFPHQTEDPGSFWYVRDGEKYIHILHDKGLIGSFLKGLFGYNSDPIWIEVILWLATLIFGLMLWRRMYRS